MRHIVVISVLVFALFSHVFGAPQEHSNTATSTASATCVHTLRSSTNFFARHFDMAFVKKFFTHWIPFVSSARVKMQFFLYKRDFPDCGRELRAEDDENLQLSGFDARHPTRIIIHGWMSQSKGAFNRAVKNAYFNLTADSTTPVSDFNVVVVDWSVTASNVNYFGVVDLIEDLGFLLAQFVRELHERASLHYDDVYLIGHSLGAQIAGSAGKQVQPFRFNTIFALDPAGPRFRDLSADRRIDASDASYVESIHTSSSLGFEQPVGHASFYPNYGHSQKQCYVYGCSHSRVYNYFAESITSKRGFWGTLCERQSQDVWLLSETGAEYRMGGEPSTPKYGTFYLRTRNRPPYALGRRQPESVQEQLPLQPFA